MKVFKLCKPSKPSKDWLSQNIFLLTLLQVAWTCPHIKWFHQITAKYWTNSAISFFWDFRFLLFCMCWLDIFKLLFIWQDLSSRRQWRIDSCICVPLPPFTHTGSKTAHPLELWNSLFWNLNTLSSDTLDTQKGYKRDQMTKNGVIWNKSKQHNSGNLCGSKLSFVHLFHFQNCQKR